METLGPGEQAKCENHQQPVKAAHSAFASGQRALLFGRAMLFHNVYFWLKPELTPAQRAEFRRGVESLAGIKAVDKVDVGVPAKTGHRPVIDHSYDIALIVQCRDVAAHDAYQVDPLHLAFVEKFKTFWTRVQIYDSE
jgi:hypothetical protein